MLPNKMRQWWNYLDSLNEKLEHPKIINLETNIEVAGPESFEVPYKISSGYNFFIYGISGFVQFSPLQVAVGEVMDRGLSRANDITVQVSMDVPEADLIIRPMTMQMLTGPELASFEPIELPHPLRLQENSTVRAVFTTRNGDPNGLRVGVSLIGLKIPTNELERVKRIGLVRGL